MALPDLVVLTWHRLDDVARLDVAVGADRGHDADRRKLGVHRDAAVLGLITDLVLAREAVRVPGRLEQAVGKPLHRVGLPGGECRLASGDIGVPAGRSRAFLGKFLVVAGLGRGQRLPPLRLSLLVGRLGGRQPGPRLGQLTLTVAAPQPAESLRGDRRELAPRGRGRHLTEFARIEGR